MPPCFDELDDILGEKPSTLSTCLISLISSTRNASNVEKDSDSDLSVDDDVPLEALTRSDDLPIETENVDGDEERPEERRT